MHNAHGTRQEKGFYPRAPLGAAQSAAEAPSQPLPRYLPAHPRASAKPQPRAAAGAAFPGGEAGRRGQVPVVGAAVGAAASPRSVTSGAAEPLPPPPLRSSPPATPAARAATAASCRGSRTSRRRGRGERRHRPLAEEAAPWPMGGVLGGAAREAHVRRGH